MIQDEKPRVSVSTEQQLVAARSALVLYGEVYEPMSTPTTPTYVGTPPMHSAPDVREYTNPFRSPHDAPPEPARAEKKAEAQAQAAPGAAGDAGEKKKKKKKKKKMHPFVRGVVILTVSPLVAAGAIVFATGAFIYGTGQVIAGVGDIMMSGPLKKTAKRAWANRHAPAAAEA